MKNNLKSLCILRLSAIGDVCHAVAVVQSIQRTYPGIDITWVIGKVEAPLVIDLPGVNFVVFDKSLGYKGMKAVWQQLSGIRFDALFIMQVAIRANILSLGIKADRRIGMAKSRAKEMHSLFCNEQVSLPSSFHVLDGFMAFAQAIGVDSSAIDWQIPCSSADSNWAQSICKGHKMTLVICPAASKASRNWSAENYVQVASYAIERGANVVLVGGKSAVEIDLAERVQQQLANASLNLVGQTSLKQLLALLAEADLLISPDTGPAHIATTVSTPVIGLYAHSNPLRTGPYFNQDDVVSVYEENAKAEHGKPVAELKWGTRNKGDQLMAQITVDQVVSKIEHVMEKSSLAWPSAPNCD